MRGDLTTMRLNRKVSGIEKVYFSVRVVALVGLGSRRE